MSDTEWLEGGTEREWLEGTSRSAPETVPEVEAGPSVWAVSTGNYDHYRVCAVFANESLAREYMEAENAADWRWGNSYYLEQLPYFEALPRPRQQWQVRHAAGRYEPSVLGGVLWDGRPDAPFTEGVIIFADGTMLFEATGPDRERCVKSVTERAEAVSR